MYGARSALFFVRYRGFGGFVQNLRDVFFLGGLVKLGLQGLQLPGGGLGLDIHLIAGQPCGQAGVLPLFADGQTESDKQSATLIYSDEPWTISTVSKLPVAVPCKPRGGFVMVISK